MQPIRFDYRKCKDREVNTAHNTDSEQELLVDTLEKLPEAVEHRMPDIPMAMADADEGGCSRDIGKYCSLYKFVDSVEIHHLHNYPLFLHNLWQRPEAGELLGGI